MDIRALIDAVMRQSTVLIAQLSTAAGIRAPLAHIADQVFVELAQEIERQGVRQKVVADMFGLALRTYQRKVRRLAESSTDRQRSLWSAVLDHIALEGPIGRIDVEQRFRNDDPKDLAAVLKDLVGSNLIHASGEGKAMRLRATTDQDRSMMSAEQQRTAAPELVWLVVFHQWPIRASEIVRQVPYDLATVQEALAQLVHDGRVEQQQEPDGQVSYRSSTILVPVGAEEGWEVAVLDHFQAMVRAIGAKLDSGQLRALADDTVGGATLHFDICAGHPLEREVRGLLEHVRTEVNELWERVEACNASDPIDAARLEVVPFYFGQGAPAQRDEEDK